MSPLATLLLFATLADCPSPMCSCTSRGNTVEGARAMASAVFIGRVDSVERFADTVRIGGTGYPRPQLRARLRVLAAWPEPVPDSLALVLADSVVWVTTAASGPACGFDFDRGKEYLVYAHGPHTDLWTTKCSRTRRLGRARKDLEQLGPPAIDRRESTER